MQVIMTKEKEMKESEEQQATLHLNAASEACEERVIVIPELGMGANDYATFGKDLKGLELEDEGLEPFLIFLVGSIPASLIWNYYLKY